MQKPLKLFKVVFIDPNPDCRSIIERVITQRQPRLSPLWLASREQALSQFREWEYQEWDLPQLIFIDLYLPQAEDGWRLLEQLKTSPEAIRQIPVIVLSSSCSQQDIGKAYQLGAASYLVKPTRYADWVDCFEQIRAYWLETVSLPLLRF